MAASEHAVERRARVRVPVELALTWRARRAGDVGDPPSGSVRFGPTRETQRTDDRTEAERPHQHPVTARSPPEDRVGHDRKQNLIRHPEDA